ncbi:MAG TPA: S8 family peptidase, partial [Bacteroidia bacterium]|nr:S8 family peptidase [Bacteroidia bacterium]
WGSSALMSQQYHYYYRGAQVPLELNTGYAYMLLNGVQSAADLQKIVGDAEVTLFAPFETERKLNKTEICVKQASGTHWAEIRFAQKLSPDAYAKRLQELRNDARVLNATPYYKSERSPNERIGISTLLYVKLRDAADAQSLKRLAADNKVEILGQNKFMPLWYTLSVTRQSSGNALEVANLMYESRLFSTAEPDIMVENLLAACPTDPLFASQWGLDNTVSPAFDVNACTGWDNWGFGSSSVQIAVLDHGYEQNHPDLTANNSGTGWDTQNGSSPSTVRGSHGTACAGIVAADQNNALGVSGIAPDCQIISISNDLTLYSGVQQDLADGLNWAWANGAEVISNSWGSNSLSSTMIDDAITACFVSGRGGLGTVVCFATGNSNNAVIYPASSNDLILSVGAMSPCGERKNPASCDGEYWWGSCFGNQLDVVAPGVLVPTTDRQGNQGYNNTAGVGGDYYLTFNGTSSATPHVAGLAGLILSMNPCLTVLQVNNIIEKTAQKVGGYGYAVTGGRDNGTWDDEMGYGLIDVDAAMRMTRELYVQNITITTAEVYQVHGSIFAGNNVDPTQTAGDVHLNAGADVDFRASTGITLDPGFNVNLGAIFNAEIISTACGSWNTSARFAHPGTPTVTEAVNAPVVPVSAKAAQTQFSVVPNPFGNELTLRYELAAAGNVQAQLYNAQGQLVKLLIPASDRSAGRHQLTVELNEGIPAGFYFVRMEVNGVVQTQKLFRQ